MLKIVNDISNYYYYKSLIDKAFPYCNIKIKKQKTKIKRKRKRKKRRLVYNYFSDTNTSLSRKSKSTTARKFSQATCPIPSLPNNRPYTATILAPQHRPPSLPHKGLVAARTKRFPKLCQRSRAAF